MSSITQVSSYAKYLGLVRNLTNGQNKVDTLSEQLTTGKKSTDLNAYGAETQKLLALRAELVQREAYVQNINTASPRVKATDTVLNSLEKLATDWQSSNLMPFQPGPATVTSAFNSNPDALKLTINGDKSTFTQNARYTVTSTPSKDGVNGSFDVTVTDGLGGKTTRTINLKTVPPSDGGGYNFKIDGGPGGGAVLNLSFDQLTAASSSTFNVSWPQANDMRDRVEGALRDIQQLLNEQFGDRYLFAGSRYGTEPVGDLLAQPQSTRVTLNGSMVNKDDYFEVSIDGKPFGYQVQPGDPKTVTFVANTLNSLIQSANPKLPIIAAAANGVISLISEDPSRKFDVQARVQNSMSIDNSMTAPTTTQAATLPAPAGTGLKQIDSFALTGDGVDIGDTYEINVTVGDPDDPFNRKYYADHPDEPEDLPPYQQYTVRYTVTEKDFNNGVTDVSKVADMLRAEFTKTSPVPPVTIDPAGNGSTIQLTSNSTMDPNHPSRVQQFTTSVRAVNGQIDNTISVATLPSQADALTDLPYVDPPDLPFYDSEYMSNRKNSKAWDKAAVTIDDGQTLTYGVTSDDRAFQKLVAAFRMAHVAASNPGKYEEYITKSRELMAQAKDEVRSVHSKVASDLATLEEKKTAHSTASATVVERIAGIEGIDETEVAARLRTSMNALEAAYTVAGQRQKLSLLNYIS
ncbi:hypothetical protein D9623_16830 [Azospirillum brasilense]|uniref:Flagellin-like protein n=1 Tax=Azospirillum brasilense TaxID=192 RepID=A0A0P0EFY5_AZOBR|nr:MULTISPECIES: hypothetical protein [Azospirillum]ALJ36798.1 hypothetical protein AMK58_14825 [Azospirillum brasilense]MDW7555903.1 hypothetical protein [Azospirillum brasilense]MDW7595980.1 hypothetical protein [Azospirillum brasilense]MDW7630985.1 hypothetical protein [Azospirillum brasilense]MDX5951591.1 hypothetical protein [Azospirillum brasilense]